MKLIKNSDFIQDINIKENQQEIIIEKGKLTNFFKI